MFKQTIIAVVLMSLLVGHSWNIEAGSRRPPRSQTYSQASESNVREKRFFNPFPKLFSIWNALTHIYSLYVEVSWSRLFVQCNRTQRLRNALCEWLHSPHNMLLSICLICFLLFYVVLFSLQQKNETYYALEQTYDIVADGFNDTYMSTIRPTVSSNAFVILRFSWV